MTEEQKGNFALLSTAEQGGSLCICVSEEALSLGRRRQRMLIRLAEWSPEIMVGNVVEASMLTMPTSVDPGRVIPFTMASNLDGDIVVDNNHV